MVPNMGRDRRRARGYRAERELVIKLWKMGFAVMRAPASGAKIKRADYPDIVAIKNGNVAVFEVKSREKASNIYIERDQIQKLMNFTKRAGGKAYIAVKIPHKEWKFIPVSELTQTKGGKYRVTKEEILKAPTFPQILKDLGLLKSLEEYVEEK